MATTQPTLEEKLREFDALSGQMASSFGILKPFFGKHAETIRRQDNRSRNGKGIGLQLEQLHKNFDGFPEALEAVSDITKRLAEIARETRELVAKNLPPSPQ